MSKIEHSLTVHCAKQLSNPSTVLDKLYTELKALPEAVMPLTHFFTPGLYTRQIFMPAGTMVISKIHKYEHPFLISKGRVTVWMNDGTSVMFQAPYTGITYPGTQRVLYIHEDCIWTTFHVTDKDNHEEIVNYITAEPDQDSITIGNEALKQIQETIV